MANLHFRGSSVFLGGLALALLSAFSPASWADESTATAVAPTTSAAGARSAAMNSGTSEATTNSTYQDILDHTYLNYFAIFHGPNATTIDSPYTVNPKGQPAPKSIGMNFDSEITAAYLITPDIGIGPDVPFLLAPVLGEGIVLGDLGVKAFNKQTIHTNDFNLYTNIIVQGATATASLARNLKYALKTTPAFRYTLPNTRLTLGSWNEIKYYSGVTQYQTFKLYTEPYVNYQLTGKLSLNVAYEMEYHHNVNDVGYFNFTTYQTDIMPGFIYMITPKVLLNPYLQIFTDQIVALDHSALGAVISATL